jgi:hypothetical protein
MSLTDPKYVSYNFDNSYSSIEKSNYAKDIILSTGLVNKLINEENTNDTYNTYNPLYDERQIQINKYYISKYQAESNVLKQIIFFCGLAILGCLFFMKGLIPESIFILYLGIIIAIGSVAVCYSIYKLYIRDNIHYDEYNYGSMYYPGEGTDMSNNNYIAPIKMIQTKDNKCV